MGFSTHAAPMRNAFTVLLPLTLLPGVAWGGIAAIVVALVALAGIFLTQRKENREKGRTVSNPPNEMSQQSPVPRVVHEPDAVYQGDKLVARVLDPEVDLEAKEVRFGEIYNSDYLVLPDECEYQQYRILVQRIAYATKIERGAQHKGRILRGVVADILGYREQ